MGRARAPPRTRPGWLLRPRDRRHHWPPRSGDGATLHPRGAELSAAENRIREAPAGGRARYGGALQPGKPAALRPRFVKVTARRGDVKAVEIAAAEAAAVRRVGRQRVGLDHGTARRDHVDERAGPAALPPGTGDDVALAAEAHDLATGVRTGP